MKLPKEAVVRAVKAGRDERRTSAVEPVSVRVNLDANTASKALAFPTTADDTDAGRATAPKIALTAERTAAGSARAVAKEQLRCKATFVAAGAHAAARSAAVPLREPRVTERSVPSPATTTTSSNRGHNEARTATSTDALPIEEPSAPVSVQDAAPTAAGPRKGTLAETENGRSTGAPAPGVQDSGCRPARDTSSMSLPGPSPSMAVQAALTALCMGTASPGQRLRDSEIVASGRESATTRPTGAPFAESA